MGSALFLERLPENCPDGFGAGGAGRVARYPRVEGGELVGLQSHHDGRTWLFRSLATFRDITSCVRHLLVVSRVQAGWKLPTTTRP